MSIRRFRTLCSASLFLLAGQAHAIDLFLRSDGTFTSVAPIDSPVTGGSAGSGWYLNDTPPAKISKFGDRVFIGDAAKYVATSPQGSANGGDWYSQFTCSAPYSLCSAIIGSTALVVETSLTNKFGTNAITGAASSLPCLGVNCGFIGVNGVAVNNVAATAGKTYNGWGFYAECNNIVNNTGSCTGAEIDIAVAFDRDSIFGTVPANNPFQQGINNAIQSTCGTGFSGFVCDTWLSLQGGSGGPNKFVTGINIVNNTIAAGRGPVMGSTGAAATVAMAMPETYDIVWYQNSSTIRSAIFGGSSGNLNLVGNNISFTTSGGSLILNTNVGVTCAGINAATFQSQGGIVTHC